MTNHALLLIYHVELCALPLCHRVQLLFQYNKCMCCLFYDLNELGWNFFVSLACFTYCHRYHSHSVKYWSSHHKAVCKMRAIIMRHTIMNGFRRQKPLRHDTTQDNPISISYANAVKTNCLIEKMKNFDWNKRCYCWFISRSLAFYRDFGNTTT